MSYERYSENKDERFANSIFQYIESSNYIGLKEKVIRLHVAESIEIDKELMDEYESIKNDLAKLKVEKTSLASQGKFDGLDPLLIKINQAISSQDSIVELITIQSPKSKRIFWDKGVSLL